MEIQSILIRFKSILFERRTDTINPTLMNISSAFLRCGRIALYGVPLAVQVNMVENNGIRVYWQQILMRCVCGVVPRFHVHNDVLEVVREGCRVRGVCGTELLKRNVEREIQMYVFQSVCLQT